jgi:glycosyltransferase involved in cell wall biosynthesis
MNSYACEPGAGSEPGVGWNWAIQAALHGHEVHVITRSNNRETIERALRDALMPGLSFHYCDLPAPFLKWKKRSGYYGLLVYYYLWQFRAWSLARHLHARHHFDIAHHVTFVNDWMPSGVAWIGIPFLWGPIGGSTNVLPRHMCEFIPPGSRRYELIRRITQWMLRSFDPFVALTRRKARMILTFTREALQGIPVRHRSRARSVIHIGVSPSDAPLPTTDPGTNDVFTIVSGSRLVHWKGFNLLIEGFAEYLRHSPTSTCLRITGDGPFKQYLQDLIRRLNVGENVQLLGHLPTRTDVFRVLASADLYAMPTLRDGPPVAILEAMLWGKPILCLDRGATAEMVPPEVGFKIEVHSRGQVVQDIARSLTWAAEHRDDLTAMGRAARTHTMNYHSWDRIGDTIDVAYEELMGQSAGPPSSAS